MRKLFLFVLIAALFQFAGFAHACGSNSKQRVDRLIIDQSLEETVRSIVAASGSKLNVSGNLSGRVTSYRISGTIDQALNQLSATYGLTWWCQGNLIKISANGDTKQCTFRNNQIERDALLNQLNGLAIDRRALNISSVYNNLYAISGPTELMNMVTNTANLMSLSGDHDVKVYRGGAFQTEIVSSFKNKNKESAFICG